MRSRTWVVTGLALLASAVVGAAWWAAAWWLRAADGVEVGAAWCERTDRQLVVGYTYGAGDRVDVSFEPRGEGDLTVSIRRRSDGGAHTMQGLMDEAWFDLPRSDSTVHSPDGRELDCRRVQPGELGALTAPRGPR